MKIHLIAFILATLLVDSAIGQPGCTTYPAFGTASVSLVGTYPGNPTCSVGAVTNSLPWIATAHGVASCPTTFSWATLQWSYSNIIVNDSRSGSSGAGCWLIPGPPGVFYAGQGNCSKNGNVCQEDIVITLGQFLAGAYLPGATYEFGITACSPASTSVKVCGSCGIQPPPPEACSCITQTPVWDNPTCSWICKSLSPILIDTDGQGFKMTDSAGGVKFDFSGDRNKVPVSWTVKDSTNAWLVLDRNDNGVIDSGREMFGNLTPQPVETHRNGFLALAVYEPKSGG